MFTFIAFLSLAFAQDSSEEFGYPDKVSASIARDTLAERCGDLVGEALTPAELGLDRPFANRGMLLEKIEASKRAVAQNYETCLLAQGAAYSQSRATDAAVYAIKAGKSVDLRARKGGEIDVKTEDAVRPYQGYAVQRTRQVTPSMVLDAKAALNGGRTPRTAGGGGSSDAAPAQSKPTPTAIDIEAAEATRIEVAEAWLRANTSPN